jgi:hypothetical protein
MYSSPNIITVTKSRKMIWEEHATLVGKKRNTYKILVGSLEGKDHFGGPRVNGRIILKKRV